MLRLAERYGHRPLAELPALFHRILQNAIHDHFRRNKVRSLWTTLLSSLSPADADEGHDPLETMVSAAHSGGDSPSGRLERVQVVELIEKGLRAASPSTPGLPHALLGGDGRGGNRQSDGLLGGQREDTLLPGDARAGSSAQGARDRALVSQERFAATSWD